MMGVFEAFLFYGFDLCPAHHPGPRRVLIQTASPSGLVRVIGLGGTGMYLETEEITGGLISSAIWLAFSPPSCET